MKRRVIASCQHRHILNMVQRVSDYWADNPGTNFHLQGDSKRDMAALSVVRALADKDALTNEVTDNIREALIWEDDRGQNYIEYKTYRPVGRGWPG